MGTFKIGMKNEISRAAKNFLNQTVREIRKALLYALKHVNFDLAPNHDAVKLNTALILIADLQLG